MRTHKISINVVVLSLTSLLMGCEPPTQLPQTSGIPEYTRGPDLSGWESRVSTLNVWGLPAISKNKKERMPAIGHAIASKNIDFMMLEEAWLKDGRNQIAATASKPYRHDVTFKSAPLDSGLMFLSNTLISRTSFRPFQLFGPVILPDAWAVKGIGMATSVVKNLPISFFSTHMLAGLSRKENPRSPFTPEWKGEMFELMAHVIEQTDSDVFVIGGDFNIKLGDEEYEFWKRISSLEGTLLEETNGDCTWCSENDYASSKSRQIDYIFVSPRLQIKDAWVDFKETIVIDGKDKHLSDHYGLVSDLTVTRGDSQKDPNAVKQSFREALLEVKQELTDYHKEKLAEVEEQQIRLDVQTKGMDERLCLSCRIEITLKSIENYERALDAPSALLTESQKALRVRLESYFNIFK